MPRASRALGRTASSADRGGARADRPLKESGDKWQGEVDGIFAADSPGRLAVWVPERAGIEEDLVGLRRESLDVVESSKSA
jgi:hypothetical protein